MTRIHAIVAEGPADLAALRGLARSMDCEPRGSRWEGRLRCERPGLVVLLRAAGSKSGLARRVLDLAESSASERAQIVGVCFDPDDDPAVSEFLFFQRQFNDIAEKERKASPIKSVGEGRFAFQIRGREVVVLPAPWRAEPSATFDNLPDHNCLERVLIGGILAAGHDLPLRGRAEQAMKDLHCLVDQHGWKRAFHLWNAALAPDTESFVDRLLQDDRSRLACLNALLSAPVCAVLRELLEVR